MPFTPEITDALNSGLDKAYVKKREQGQGRNRISLSYIEAWHVIAEANRIFGFDGWTRETVRLDETNRDLVEIKNDRGAYEQWRVGYLAKVRITAHGVAREGSGFGIGIANKNSLGDAIESAVKEAESDAMKRAMMTFGHPFGLALYDKTQSNVVDGAEDPKPKPQAEGSPFDDDNPDPVAEWANRNWTADKLDVRQMKLADTKVGTTMNALIDMVNTAPTLPRVNEFVQVNATTLKWLSENKPDAHKRVKHAIEAKRVFFAQSPNGNKEAA